MMSVFQNKVSENQTLQMLDFYYEMIHKNRNRQTLPAYITSWYRHHHYISHYITALLQC